MEPSPSPEASAPLGPAEVDALFALAVVGIRAGLEGHGSPTISPTTLAPALQEWRAAFVTLEVGGELNGCIGTLDAVEPLGAAVARLAWEAAFADPRLPPLTAAEFPSLEIKLSLIGPRQPLPAGSEAQLVAALRPGVDGLVIRWGQNQATFLPAMWPKLPDRLAFVRHLESKAGLAPGRWPAGMRAWRYTATEYRRRAGDIRPESWSAA